MSYIKSCTKCGQKISLREMAHGQWVAFDPNTDKPHKHGKGSRKKASANRRSKHIEREVPVTNDGFSTNQLFIVCVVLAVLVYLFFVR